jgi:two-component system sensor histidine kinase CpxA
MRISRLYVKYFVFVMTLIIASQLFIALMFSIVMSSKKHQEHDDRFFATGEILRSRVHESVEMNGKEKLRIQDITNGVELPYKAELWLTDTQGTVISANTSVALPVFPSQLDTKNGIGLSIHRNGNKYGFIVIQCKTVDGLYTIHMRTVRPPLFHGDPAFLIGLMIVTVIVALVLFPITRKTTIPLRRLTESANAIASGNLDVHVEEKTGDEIGELAKAFNLMSDKIRLMIRGTSELTANVSHQIRSPLARISIAAEILREQALKGDTPAIEKTINTIEQEIEYLDLLTGRIIELTRTELALVQESNAAADLAAEGKAAVERYAEMIFKKKIGFIEKIHGPALICATQQSIQGLFDILFDNAVKYCPGGKTIRLSIRTQNDRAIIEIINTAAPVSEKSLTEIFKPFVRNESERIQGFGLGLAIASHIVENLHGTIRAENAEDGLCFIIDFPLRMQYTG